MWQMCPCKNNLVGMLAGVQHQRDRGSHIGQVQFPDDPGSPDPNPTGVQCLLVPAAQQAPDHHRTNIAFGLLRDVQQLSSLHGFDQPTLYPRGLQHTKIVNKLISPRVSFTAETAQRS